MQKYYAVKTDDFKNIYNSWDEAKKVIDTLKAPKFKSFSDLESAKAFLDGIVLKPIYEKPTAYIDGSYDDVTKAYSFGGILFIDGKEITFKRKFENDKYIGMRNVAGEIKGAAYIINYCVKNNIKELDIYYDYQGIENWYTGFWKASSPIAVEYVKFIDKIKNQIDVRFHKVKSHTNNYYNDMADKLAKEALGI